MDRHGLNNQQISLALVFFAFGDLIGKLLIAIFGGSLPFQRVYYLSASMFLATAEFGVMSIANTIEHFLALSIGKVLSQMLRVKNTTLYLSSSPSLILLFEKSGGYFTLLEPSKRVK